MRFAFKRLLSSCSARIVPVSYCSRFPLQDALRQALRENVEADNRALSCGEIAEWEDHSK